MELLKLGFGNTFVSVESAGVVEVSKATDNQGAVVFRTFVLASAVSCITRDSSGAYLETVSGARYSLPVSSDDLHKVAAAIAVAQKGVK